MRRFLQIFFLNFSLYFIHCKQPYFPSQVVFKTDYGAKFYAIDEDNQRAFASVFDSNIIINAYAYQHFPYSPMDTPQSKHYVQLRTNLHNDSNKCEYETYWKYGTNIFTYFPRHWDNFTSFQIKNYLRLDYPMIHSDNKTISEDYWYANETCLPSTGDERPCFEIYFKKNTDIPLRSIQFVTLGFHQVFLVTYYDVISVGKPDDKYFNSIHKDWYTNCLDGMLGVEYNYTVPVIKLHEKKIVGVSLSTPPHKINGNDTMTIQWNVTVGCTDCLTWTPTEMSFNGQNFYQIQNLTVYRKKNSEIIFLSPIFHGGAFETVSTEDNAFYLE